MQIQSIENGIISQYFSCYRLLLFNYKLKAILETEECKNIGRKLFFS